MLARLLFLLSSSTSDGERERFLLCSVSGIVRQFQCYFLVFFLWICGMAREYGCDSGGYGVGRECKGDARTKERANEILYRHTFKFNDGCSRQGVATNTDTHQCLQIGSNYRNIMSLEVLSLLTTSKACQKEEEYRLTGATHLISIRVRIKPVSPK